MERLESLDLSGLAQFKASALLASVGAGDDSAVAAPMQLALSRIDLDAAQPRRTVSEASLAELARSIRLHGVLEPISVRSHAQIEGRFVVNRGERRLRASRLAGLSTVPAFLDERHDPYAQAAENLHREDMSPFDLARFIAEREREGQARAEIARRLGKPRSFITEAAALIDAPPPVREAFDQGRLGADLRVLYRLAGAMKARPQDTAALLASADPISRANVESVLAHTRDREGEAAGPAARDGVARPARIASAGRTVLVVEHAGRRGSLRLKAHDKDVGEVRFGDGSRTLVRLAELRPLCWATEE
ncbi:ParB/RepB/Spo0J family partition protein [Variovorax saccharolyticus]|uniref:ParB/RepB/Spo0J family partition protein n=1 Tax=Variovorax saccharolyticus TaxID=3053516 RepID=UPI0025772FA5|nr:ParB/RepB/Spo0J family partition protein [Variovorax sp. J31P216]MDM0030365.1 ParB/RepB/Spo0J family partition protein [Variovorax sp. J31P216]